MNTEILEPESAPTNYDNLAKDPEFHTPEDTVFGQTIHPFGMRRMVTAQKLGVNLFIPENTRIVEECEEQREEYIGNGGSKDDDEYPGISYPGVFEDLINIPFLCTLTDSEHMKFRRQPDRFSTAADKWAERNGVNFEKDNAALAELSEAFEGIMNSLGE